MVTLYVLANVFTRGHPTLLYLGEDHRYSSSKFQTLLWFSLVISAYMAIVSLRIYQAGWDYVGGVDIPQNLFILSGISAGTFVVAKEITIGKVKDNAGFKTAGKAQASDLISNDNNEIDREDFQMVAITILAVIVYAVSIVAFMEQIVFRHVVTLPDLDTALLSLVGFAHGGYLAKKAVGDQSASKPDPKTGDAASNPAASGDKELTENK